ncbi:MAG: hypothetical protein HY721_05495, partial [Planctomycetes bacterium]|nr:hypothetical protein [Planctomycetota bacterium]
MQATKLDVAALVAQVPDADQPERASKLTGPKPEAAEALCRQVLAGGR